MTNCQICRTATVDEVLDLGPQPILNRYRETPQWVRLSFGAEPEEERYPLILGQCRVCHLLQLIDPIPADLVKPKLAWITSKEPERHIPALAGILADLMKPLGRYTTVLGASIKDESLIRSLVGWRAGRMDDPSYGYGPADVIVARHILEHQHDTQAFIKRLKEHLSPNGYIVIEVPDCTQALHHFDYSMLWEEHTLYFTHNTFHETLEACGLKVVQMRTYPYRLEDCMVAVCQVEQSTTARQAPISHSVELDRAQRYGVAYSYEPDRIRAFVESLPGKTAVFGAGHLALAFVNLVGLSEWVECFIDDDPHKMSLYAPGSGKVIAGGIVMGTIDNIILGANPEWEEAIIAKHADWGGRWLSIFPTSKYSIRRAMYAQ